MSSTSSGGLPEGLRERIGADIEPVRPLAAPWKRVLWAIPVAIAVLVVPILWLGLRGDAEEIGFLLSWAPTVLQLALGLAILALALRESVPGLGISAELAGGVCAAALGVHIAFNLMIYLREPMGYGDFLQKWWGCFRYEVLLALPFLVLVTWLASSALPVRPRLVGLLAGVGGGFLADASWRLICPISSPMHVLTAHGGAILVLGAIGYLLGIAWERLLLGRR